MRRLCVVGIVGVALAGCSLTPSDVGGGKLTVTGCRSTMAVGQRMTIHARWTSPRIAKYTLFRLSGAGSFVIESVFDEHLSRGQRNGVSGEYDLPGPRSAGAEKTVVAMMSANKAGNNTISVSVWGSGDALSAAPSNVASSACSVAIGT